MLTKQTSMRGSRGSADYAAAVSPPSAPTATLLSSGKKGARRNSSGIDNNNNFDMPSGISMSENTCTTVQSACFVSFDSVLGLLGIASPTKGADEEDLFIERDESLTTHNATSTEKLSKSDNDFKVQFESVLERNGFLATLYLPSVDNSRPKRQVAVMRKKKSQDRIDCEVIVDNKPKLFRFSLSDVTTIGKGKGKSKVVPPEIDESLCMYFAIKDKGELSLVLKSESLRNDILRGFNILNKV